MPGLGKTSRQRLAECDPDLRLLFTEVAAVADITIICGGRGEADQNKAFEQGFSKVKYPNSKHNKVPSQAVDVMPYPVNWTDKKGIIALSKIVWATWNTLKHKGLVSKELRWGADWNRNGLISDERFLDLPHWELID